MEILADFLTNECALDPEASLRRSLLYHRYVSHANKYPLSSREILSKRRVTHILLNDHRISLSQETNRRKKYFHGITLQRIDRLIVPIRDESRTPSPLHLLTRLCPLIFIDRSRMPSLPLQEGDIEKYTKWNEEEDRRLTGLLETCRRDFETQKILELKQILASECTQYTPLLNTTTEPLRPLIVVHEEGAPLLHRTTLEALDELIASLEESARERD